MRFQEIKLLDNYELVHLVTVEPTIVLDAWTLSGSYYYAIVDGPVTRVWIDGAEYLLNDSEILFYDEATSQLRLLTTASINPHSKTIIAAVRFHFASKPAVLPRHLEESPLSADSGSLTEHGPQKLTLGWGTFFVSVTDTPFSDFLNRTLTVKEVYMDWNGGTYRYVFQEGPGTRWCKDAVTLGNYLDYGTLTDTWYVGSPTQFLPLVSAVSGVSQTVDNENRHVPFESSGTVTLLNDQVFFGNKWAKYTWHHAVVKVYWYALESEAVDPELLYQGRATDLDYTNDKISITFSTDSVTSSREFRCNVTEFAGIQETFGDNPDAVVTPDVATQIARTPYGRVSDFLVQSVRMDVPEGETLGGDWTFTSGSPYVTVPTSGSLTSIFPGDVIIQRTTGLQFTVLDHGKIPYGVSGSASAAMTAESVNLGITISTANFSSIVAGDVVVLTPNASFNTGAGVVVSVPSSTKVIVSLDGVPGYGVNVTVPLQAGVLTFYKAGQNKIRLDSNAPANLTSADVGVVHKITKLYSNRTLLLSPAALYAAPKYVHYVASPYISVFDLPEFSVGDKIILDDDDMREIATIDYESGLVTLVEGVSGIAEYDQIRRAPLQRLDYVSSSGAVTNIPLEGNTIVADMNNRTYVTVLPTVQELSAVFNDMNIQVRRKFVIDDALNNDDTYPGKLKDVQVGDVLTVNTVQVVVCEKINDYAVLAYPQKDGLVFSILAAAWNAYNNFYTASHKRYKAMDNNTKFFTNCYGVSDTSYAWIRTPADVLKHTLLSMRTFDDTLYVDTSTIETLDTVPMASYSVPKAFASTIPTLYKEVINDMCEMTHAAVYSEIAYGAPRFTARGMFDAISVGSVTDTDVLDVPETEIDFKGGPATIRAKYRIGDAAVLEMTKTEARALGLGNKELSERNVWMYSEVDVDTWLAKELKLNTGPRKVLKFTCAAARAPKFGDRVRCTFRNNPVTERLGDPTSKYIEGLVLSHRHGADGQVYCEVDDLSGLSDKDIEAELLVYVTSRLAMTSLAFTEAGDMVVNGTKFPYPVTDSLSYFTSVCRMTDTMWLLAFVNYLGYPQVVPITLELGKFKWGAIQQLASGATSGGYKAKYMSICKLRDGVAVVTYRDNPTTHLRARTIFCDGDVIDSIAAEQTIASETAFHISCNQHSDTAVMVGFSTLENSYTANNKYFIANVLSNGSFSVPFTPQTGVSGRCFDVVKLRDNYYVACSCSATGLKAWIINESGDVMTAVVLQNFGGLSCTHMSVRRTSDYNAMLTYTYSGGQTYACPIKHFMSGGWGVIQIGTEQSISSYGGKPGLLIPYDEATKRFIAVAAPYARMLTADTTANTIALGAYSFYNGSEQTSLAGVRVFN